jgi:hypothetical protein
VIDCDGLREHVSINPMGTLPKPVKKRQDSFVDDKSGEIGVFNLQALQS